MGSGWRPSREGIVSAWRLAFNSRRPANGEAAHAPGALRPTLNPVRLWRRHRRLRREAADEALWLRQRHGSHALAAALAKLERKDLTPWGRAVVQRAARLLRKG
jgi:hypothetical protein